MRSFSPGAVAIIALWKSAPKPRRVLKLTHQGAAQHRGRSLLSTIALLYGVRAARMHTLITAERRR